jgi:hypothetical protein
MPRFSGNAVWILFFHYNGVYYSVSISMKDYRIFPIDIRICKELFEGTVMEGVFYYDRINNHKIITIEDIHMLSGNKCGNYNFKDRHQIINNILCNDIRQGNYYTIAQAPYFNIDEKQIISLFNETSQNMNIVNWLFYPNNPLDKYSKKVKIFQYRILQQDRAKIATEKVEMTMKKTKKTDIYSLMRPGSDIQVDIACVKDMATSKKYSSWFNDKDELLVKCVHEISTNKWYPIEIIQRN